MIEDVFEKTASANECTGLFQRIHLDPEEIKTFHKMYNELNLFQRVRFVHFVFFLQNNAHVLQILQNFQKRP